MDLGAALEANEMAVREGAGMETDEEPVNDNDGLAATNNENLVSALDAN